ncbi:MAG: Rne/Rng family ribonuclease [Moraxella sp.]|nr:Rne/Rng family ribonuclease [Moraxella sp.]
MKRILINATHNEEIRVALCKDNHLYDFDLENRTREQKKANIYKGHITRIEPSLEAVFVEYGSSRQGFLPLREIAPEYLDGNPREDNIKKLLKEGDELIIQVEKEERGNKGAAISTYISLAGRYLVLMPNNSKGGGISRQISGKVRDEMRQIIASLDVPRGMSIIVRTAGIGKTYEDLQNDLAHLLDIWATITQKAKQDPSPCLLYQEAGVVTRAVRDYLRDDIGEVWIDSEHAYNEAASFISAVMPTQMGKLRKYVDFEPMFVRFGIERQIESAYQREVRLPSGGSIVIDQTEALVSIDINSSKSTKGSDVAETAYHTNLEAADEIARQLRLRDMGGLIVIDFIDMADPRHQKDVEKRLIDATRYDRARVQFAEISKFGLMQMSRQRLRPSLEESTGYICPRCHGNGMIRDVRSLALSIMRQIEQLALKHRSGEVQAEVPTEIAAFLLNEKRESLVYLEQDSGTRITILPHAHLESPNFSLHFNPDGFAPASYDRIVDVEEQQNVGRGYDVDWQTKQPTTPQGANHWQKTNDAPKQPAQKSEPQKPAHTPQAVAWLSNLFAPKAEAQLAGSLGSSEAAAAIEAIVNTGAASLGVAGSIAINPSQKDPRKERPDQKRPKKDERTDRKTEVKPEQKERTEKDTRQKERSEAKEKHEEKYQKREAGSRREPREPVERTEALTKDRVKAEQHTEQREQGRIDQRAEQKDPAEKTRNAEPKHAEPRQPENADHKPEVKAEKHSEPKAEKTTEPKANKNKDGFNVRVERLAKDDTDVPTVHLSLDGSKGDPKRKEVTPAEPVAVTADTALEVTIPAVHNAEKSEKKAKPKAEKTPSVSTEEKPAQAPTAETRSEAVESRAEKPAKAKKSAKKPKTLALSETEKATALAIARETRRAVNDPRVIKAALMKQPATLTGTAGAFIKARLENAEARLAKDGFVACFIAAMNTQNAPTATFDFSNFGYEPLSEKAESVFFERITATTIFGTGAGKTDAPARPPKQRAVNDPRGEHPAFLAHATKVTDTDAPASEPTPEPKSMEVMDKMDTPANTIVIDEADTHSPSETTHSDAVQAEHTRPTTSTDNDAETENEQAKDTQSLTEKAEHAIDELIGTLKDGLSRLGDMLPDNASQAIGNETKNAAQTGDTASEADDAGKTTPASYKNMIENIAEQLLPQTGILKLATPKLATPKKPTKKSTKVAIKVPKADKKPKSEVRKKPAKPAEETDSPSES